MTYKGKYRVKNIDKYAGDHTKIKYRSMWERNAMKWCDTGTERVTRWSSEEVVVPYLWSVDKRWHRYYVDLLIELDGEIILIEIKPKKETVPPKVPARKTKKYINEVTTYIKNQDKWKYAEAYAKKRGWRFEIWHEDVLKNKGIRLLKG